jgi:hypothetical protein
MLSAPIPHISFELVAGVFRAFGVPDSDIPYTEIGEDGNRFINIDILKH